MLVQGYLVQIAMLRDHEDDYAKVCVVKRLVTSDKHTSLIGLIQPHRYRALAILVVLLLVDHEVVAGHDHSSRATLVFANDAWDRNEGVCGLRHWLCELPDHVIQAQIYLVNDQKLCIFAGGYC